MPEILQYGFMQKALLVGLLVGMLCPAIGTFLVLRRFSMVGDTLAHVSLAGILLGLIWQISPLPLALAFSLLITFFLEKLRNIFTNYAELALALIMSWGLGLAVILIGFTNISDTSMASLLFGSIITLTRQDILLIIILALLTLFLLSLFYRNFFFLIFDETGAYLAGLKTKHYNYLLLFLTAMVITMSLRIIGALLVSSLIVVPVATSLLFERGFYETFWGAILLGVLAVILGLTAAFYLDLAPGGTIVLATIFPFLFVLFGKKILKAK